MPAERSVAERETGGGTEPAPADDERGPAPSDAFQALGSETRTTILRALSAAEGGALAFSDLFDATDADTTAGFAYHLRQLADRFVGQRDDGRYELTAAGRAAARNVRAGTYTQSVDRGPVELAEACPLCGATALESAVTDNVTEVACGSCESTILRVSLPPSAYDRDESLPRTVDDRYRRRIGAFSDGTCPDCAGPVDCTVESLVPVENEELIAEEDEELVAVENEELFAEEDEELDIEDNDELDDDATVPVRAVFECETCGSTLRCPVALTLLDHPAVVAFYHDHGEDVRERPVWNVGSEWRERLLSRDPWCVAVSTRLEGDDLVLYVARDTRVVDHRRFVNPTANVADGPERSDDDPDGDRPDAATPETTGDKRPSESDTDGRSELDHSSAADSATA